MLSLEFIGMGGLLFGFVIFLTVVCQVERRSARIPESVEKAPEWGSEPVRTEQ
jgi:hypothetical protein